MSMTRGTGSLFLIVVFFLVFGGCAPAPSGKSVPIPPGKNPVEQLTTLEKDIAGARKRGLDVMAPTRFAKVEAFYNEARDGMERETELSGILQKISLARGHLQLAEESAQIANSALGSAIKARELARQAGAAELGEDYQYAEDQFLRLTRAIEADNLRWAQNNEVKVARLFDHLELRAIKDKALGEARRLVAKAEKQRAGRLVPITVDRARKQLEEADAFITQSRYQQEKIDEYSRRTLFEARRLHRLLEQSEKLKAMTSEQIAFWMESFLARTAEGLGTPDRRDEDFDLQIASILGALATWQGECGSLGDELDKQTGEIAGLQARITELEGLSREEQGEKERLAAERRFLALFNEVQGFFSKDEAEVYKQGDNLVIRLKAIQFPVGQAVIMSGNYALLSKVQKAIKVFGQPSVTIEGHSDSTGQEAANLELSQGRAEAVRQYLVANQTLPAEKLQAVGFGSARPLASNQTAEGRAVNRRIDLILTPEPAGK